MSGARVTPWVRGLRWVAGGCLVLPLPLLFGRFSPGSWPGRWQAVAWLVFVAGMLGALVLARWRARPEALAQEVGPHLPPRAVADDEAPDAPPNADDEASSDATLELPRDPVLSDAAAPPEGPWGAAFWQAMDGARLQALATAVLASAPQPLRAIARPGQADLMLQPALDPEGPSVGVLRCHLVAGDEVVRIDKLRPLLVLAQRHGLAHAVLATNARVGQGARDFAAKHAITLLDPLALSAWLAAQAPECSSVWGGSRSQALSDAKAP